MTFSGNSNENSTTIVSNDGWWPDMPVAKFQKSYRMPTEYAEDVMTDGLVLAMAWANKQLASWRAELAELNYADLVAVPSSELAAESLLIIYYRRAVFSHAKAYLLTQYPTINRRDAAKNEARENPDTEDKFLEYAQQAIADFMGVGRVTVELI